MLSYEEGPWIEYLTLDEETLETILRPETPKDIRDAYERYKENERRMMERGERIPK